MRRMRGESWGVGWEPKEKEGQGLLMGGRYSSSDLPIQI